MIGLRVLLMFLAPRIRRTSTCTTHLNTVVCGTANCRSQLCRQKDCTLHREGRDPPVLTHRSLVFVTCAIREKAMIFPRAHMRPMPLPPMSLSLSQDPVFLRGFPRQAPHWRVYYPSSYVLMVMDEPCRAGARGTIDRANSKGQ